ncbi:hypothetical protein CTEN210_08632 [Chaetoceros tenuissimus]|uniref:DUF1279 domain-containing protein n=1 Tax=Chaetoceros tenuissimus TaxID=426638 RepID=A0AAD3H6L0_9STRA|nr:hypothetical protein CTEN210_08632 [Chaetoceros tenuissimus]
MLGVASQRAVLRTYHKSCYKMMGAMNTASYRNVIMQGSSSRFYSVLTKDEEEAEKKRVASLSKYQKEIELRDLDKELARLNTLRGINTGELYTMRGKFKALARDYGMAFMAWYWTVWCSTAALTYGAIEMGLVDAMQLIGQFDVLTGFDLSSKVDPQLGAIGVTLVFNEMLEPLRLPIVVMTTKPIVETLYPRKF